MAWKMIQSVKAVGNVVVKTSRWAEFGTQQEMYCTNCHRSETVTTDGSEFYFCSSDSYCGGRLSEETPF